MPTRKPSASWRSRWMSRAADRSRYMSLLSRPADEFVVAGLAGHVDRVTSLEERVGLLPGGCGPHPQRLRDELVCPLFPALFGTSVGRLGQQTTGCHEFGRGALYGRPALARR